MNYNVEEFNKLKEIESEIESKIKSRINEEWNSGRNILEDDFYCKIDGIAYGFICEEEGDWEDEGKYQFSTDEFKLVSFDDSKEKHPHGKNIIDTFNLFVSVGISRSGSYYTDYYYDYDKPQYFKGEVSHVEEVVIPAHDIVKFKC